MVARIPKNNKFLLFLITMREKNDINAKNKLDIIQALLSNVDSTGNPQDPPNRMTFKVLLFVEKNSNV
jgi:hypothetical protein